MAICGISDFGLDGMVVDIECSLSNGLPSMVIVGQAGRSVDESRERIRSAFTSSNVYFPKKRIAINLAPSDLPKQGSGLDIAIAVAIINAHESPPHPDISSAAFLGELGLDGTVRPIRGIIGKILTAKKHGIRTFYVPYGNMTQVDVVPNINFVVVGNLESLYRHLNGSLPLPSRVSQGPRRLYYKKKTITETYTTSYMFDEVKGQDLAKRAVEVAAAGNHNLLLYGPPGTGKTMLAQALNELLPPLSDTEILEVAHLHSLVTRQATSLPTRRPFRNPHHATSYNALTGGGARPQPGEMSLAHRGVLLLDELPEFSRPTIEAMRQPLESHKIIIARSSGNFVFPAQFLLVATANPCPCGYYGSQKSCVCNALDIRRYQKKMVGPIMDRIDLRVEVDQTEHTKLLADNPSYKQSAIKVARRIRRARARQAQRFGNSKKTNNSMTNSDFKRLSNIDKSAQSLLDKAAEHMKLSSRGYVRCLKVAQTIADLDETPVILETHVAEALQFRGGLAQ